MRFVIALTVSLFLSGTVQGGECAQHLALSIDDGLGGRYGVYVNAEAIGRTPGWSPDLGEPPLLLSEAVSLARQWLQTYQPEATGSDIDRIALRRFHCSATGEEWYYLFHFVPREDADRGTRFAGILMDGSVIAPVRE